MAQKAPENWDRLFQLFLARPNGIVTKSTYLRRSGNYCAVVGEGEEQKTQELPAPMGTLALSLLDIEGELPCTPTAFTLTEDAGWVFFALADLARRTHCKSLLGGTPEADLTADPMKVVEALEGELFPGVDDMRFLSPFLSVTLGIRAKPDLKKAWRDLVAAEFLGQDGNMTREGALLLSAFAQVHTMLGVYGYKKEKGQDTLCCGAALNCYHSLWSVAYDSGENAFYLTVMSRKEMAMVLEGIFA